MDDATKRPNRADLEALDRAHFFHPSTHLGAHARGDLPARVVEGGEGCTIVDRDGNRLLDAFAGLYCVNVGYGRREIADAIHAQASQLAYYHAYVGHGSEAAIRLAAKIIELAPDNMQRVYFGLGGSDANETQVKLVWYYNNVLGRPDKRKIISRRRGYHGSGLMTGSLTGLTLFHDKFNLPVDVVRHTVCPHYWKHAEAGESEEAYSQRCAEALEALIVEEGPETVAAFIAEPVMGTGGLIPPPAGYWAAIQPVLQKYDVLMIADEVVTGFGRMGTWFGAGFYDFRPDLMTIAKGLTSAYLPLSGVIVGERVWSVLADGTDKFGPIGHGWTYSAHPTCAAAGLANIEILEREAIPAHVARVGPLLTATLKSALADVAGVGEVRGAGMLAGVEFAADPARRTAFDPALKVGPRISAACLKRSMIARAMPEGDILGFAPPLVLSEAEVERIARTTREAVSEVMDELVRDGHGPA